MGFKDMFRTTSNGVAADPSTGQVVRHPRHGWVALESDLSKGQRKSGAVSSKAPSRADRKARTGWGSSADFKKAKGR